MPSISTLVCALAARDSNAAKRISKCFFIMGNDDCVIVMDAKVVQISEIAKRGCLNMHGDEKMFHNTLEKFEFSGCIVLQCVTRSPRKVVHHREPKMVENFRAFSSVCAPKKQQQHRNGRADTSVSLICPV